MAGVDQVCAQHHELAHGKVDDPGAFVDQDKSQGHQGQQSPREQTDQGKLGKGNPVHQSSELGGGEARPSREPK